MRAPFRLRPALRPPLALGAVATSVAAVIATGHHAPAPAATAPAAVVQPVATAPSMPDRPVVAKALHAVLRASDTRASRSEHRTALRAQHRHHRAAHHAPAHRWVRPNAGPLSSPFGYRWGRLHAGVDLAGPYGSPILAATDGCITYAGPMSGYGEVIQMKDWDGTETVYGHMSAFVRTHGCVKAGQVIARVGAAGDATGPHLHFEVRVNGTPIDPIPFMAKRGVHI